jgi:tripeptide aminopeptidase
VAEYGQLLDRFVRLCEIPSPTGNERAVADAVIGELRAHGVEVSEDGSAVAARAGAGNVIARVPGSRDEWVGLCAHLDTVPHEGPIAVARENGVFRSRGETILGADDKAAVTVLVELAMRYAVDPAPVGVELVLTVAEEDGLRGAKQLARSSLRSRCLFVIDHASPIGEIITAAPTYHRLVAEFEGTEAHAGIRPEDGHSAIAAAAAAIAGMKLGRLDEGTTANVGLIQGGTASNVVPGHCRIEGEARSLDEPRAAATLGEMIDACTWAASELGCDLDVDAYEVFRGYRLRSTSEPVEIARAALARRGHDPHEIASGGGSDANAFHASGFPCVLLANGTEANHTPQERVSAAAIHEMLDVCLALVEEAAARW